MTLLFDHARTSDTAGPAPVTASYEARSRRGSSRAKVIEIGLVNNMGDAALRATERQFMRLLDAGSGDHVVRLHCFALPSIARSSAARQWIATHYADITELDGCRLDGLIVTGAEPRAATLPDEPYWDDMRALVDWASVNTRSTIWSCLAAHAAVLHLDGIERHRLPRKCSGVYAAQRLCPHDLLADLPPAMKVPHSRLNGLDPSELARRGYQLLTHVADAGCDSFVREDRSRFVFFQGHPEYDAESLKREYLRDVGRFLSGERDAFPETPEGYFCTETESSLTSFGARAAAERRPEIISALPQLRLRGGLAVDIDATATTLFRNWVATLAGQP